MDMRPSVLPQREVQARKAAELAGRGYSAAEIAAALGLRENRIDDLLHDSKVRKQSARAHRKN